MDKPEVDEFHGRGGAYIVENGVRRCVEEPTKDHPEGNGARDHKGKLLAFDEKPKARSHAPAAAAPADKKGGDK